MVFVVAFPHVNTKAILILENLRNMQYLCQRCHSLINFKDVYDDDLLKLKNLPKSRFVQASSLTEMNESGESDDQMNSSSEDYPAQRLQLYKKTISEGDYNFDNVPPPELRTPTLDSFVVLPAAKDGYEEEKNSPEEVNDLFSWKIEIYNRIFDLLSSKTKVDHPLCVECAELLTEEMSKTLRALKEEKKMYFNYDNFLSSQTVHEENTAALDSEIDELMKQINEKEEKIEEISDETDKLQKLLRELDEEKEKVYAEEQEFYNNLNQFQIKKLSLERQYDCANLEFEHNSRKLEKLQKMNVFSDIFYISHYSEPNGEGSIATINGLRLGRLPSQKVNWAEINAAWGMTVLLLDVLTEKLDFHSSSYQLKPFGSQSFIIRFDRDPNGNQVKPTKLDLFSSGELKIFMNRRFDQGMVAFLDYLHQFGDFCAAKTPSAVLPYAIENDRIGGKCIRLAFNQDENWTRALKFVLTDIKFLEAYVSSQDKQSNF